MNLSFINKEIQQKLTGELINVKFKEKILWQLN